MLAEGCADFFIAAAAFLRRRYKVEIDGEGTIIIVELKFFPFLLFALWRVLWSLKKVVMMESNSYPPGIRFT